MVTAVEEQIAAVLAGHLADARRLCEHGRPRCRCGFHLCERSQPAQAFNQSDHQAEMVAELFTAEIETVEQLLALPVQAVVRDKYDIFYQHDKYDLWHEFGTEMSGSHTSVDLPATVVWLPGVAT